MVENSKHIIVIPAIRTLITHAIFLTLVSDVSCSHWFFRRNSKRKLEFNISDDITRRASIQFANDNTIFFTSRSGHSSIMQMKIPMQIRVSWNKRTKIVSIVTLSNGVIVPSAFVLMYQMIMKQRIYDITIIVESMEYEIPWLISNMILLGKIKTEATTLHCRIKSVDYVTKDLFLFRGP